ncbi:MAG TPA: hypothetical protein DCQ94_10060 [Nitrospira sp.]|nr:hypothetical protein [Nitrospira sp.]
MRNTSAGGVLASLSGSPYGGNTIRHVARCGLAERPVCASSGVSCYRYGAGGDPSVLGNTRVVPQPAGTVAAPLGKTIGLPRSSAAGGSPMSFLSTHPSRRTECGCAAHHTGWRGFSRLRRPSI